MPRQTSFLPLLMLLALLAACGRSTPTNYYLLESGLSPVQSGSLPSKSLRVARVNVPEYLDRNGIVSRVHGQTRLIVAQFHVWAEPLSQGVGRVTREVLTPPLLAAGVNVLPGGGDAAGEYALLLDVQRLDGNFEDKAVLEARWALRDHNDTILGQGIYAGEEMVRGRTYDALAGAESFLVRRMAEYLAQTLPPLMMDNKP